MPPITNGDMDLQKTKKTMKTSKLLYMSALLAGTLSFTACELDEYNPSGGDANITNYNVWRGLQAYCYSPLNEGLFSEFNFLSVAEGGTDMFENPSKDYAQEVFFYEGLTPSVQAPKVTFNQAYTTISTCNAVINHADEVEGADKDILVAEAKTLRAYYNLVLVTYYGPVTLSDEDISTGIINTRPKRNTVEEFYTAIIKDLKEAAAVLPVQPLDGNYGRVCKKTALGLMARAYAQGAGEGLSEDGVSYWMRAKDTAEELIKNASSYNIYLYDDVSDLWAQANNRNNPEALFIVSGVDANNESANYMSVNRNQLTFTFCNPNKLEDLYKIADKSNYYLGRVNNNAMAPTPYAIDVFDASWDKRWENTFMTAFGTFSMVTPGWLKYDNYGVEITQALIDKYGMGQQFLGDSIRPYAEINAIASTYKGNQYDFVGAWPKGGYAAHHADPANLITGIKNPFVIDYPVDVDDDRFAVVLSKDYKTDAEKAQSRYFTVNIRDLFDGNQYKRQPFDGTNSYQLYPSLIKYNWLYNGVSEGSNLQRRYGDIMVMRTAELYLIAAEAWERLGDAEQGRKYLEKLRNRAARPGTQAPALGTITEETILDEYAREMAGEYCRWALLKRHHLLGERLKRFNSRAAESFDESIHYCRPISNDFLQQIDNRDEYGDNGYGTTPTKGY